MDKLMAGLKLVQTPSITKWNMDKNVKEETGGEPFYLKVYNFFTIVAPLKTLVYFVEVKDKRSVRKDKILKQVSNKIWKLDLFK